jgi:hypothetical protein
MLKSASATDPDNPHLDDILAGEDPHQEKTVTEIETACTEGDPIHVHPMEIEDAENTPVKDKENIKIEIEIKSKAKEKTEIVQDLDKKNTEKEDKVGRIRPESDELPQSTHDLYNEGN